MLKALYWRVNLSIKKIKSKRLKKKLGKNVKAIITESKNGIFAVDPEDLEVGQKILSGGLVLRFFAFACHGLSGASWVIWTPTE